VAGQQRPAGPTQPDGVQGKTGDDFRALSHKLLHAASLGAPRVNFIRDASRTVVEFSGCDLIELWLRDGNAYHCCRIGGPPEWSFTCEILDQLPGHDTGPAHSPDQASDLNRLATIVFTGNLKPFPSHITRKGSFWTGNAEIPFRYPQAGGDRASATEYRLGHDYLSIALIPLVVADRRIGLMQMKARAQDHFTESEVVLYERVAQNLAMALVHQSVQSALRERVKELTCLYSITQLSQDPYLPIDVLLKKIAGLLPPAWQYPDIAAAAVTLDGKRYTTPGFEDFVCKQTAEIAVRGETRGVVEVVYKEPTPDLDEGPFLKEERGLIDAVAQQLAMIIERRQAAEDRMRLQDQLRHADRLATIGQLAAGVAHELNEPLGSILGFAQLAQKTSGLPDQTKGDIEKIVNACLHARQVIQKLMMFARHKLPQKAQVNLNELVKEGLFFLERRCLRQGIEVKRSLDPELPEITADPSQLHQVLVNLVVNAIQAMPNGGTLTLKTARTDDHVALVVEDTGVGMSNEVMKKIFIPFFTTKQVGEGVGLGLAVVHGIVTGHTGSIEVQSVLGRGSCFEVKLPVTEPASEREE
jgi:signal transduction histidine kinase